MTFSLIFADPDRGVVGGGAHSHYPFVGAIVLRARAGVGASLSQGAGSAALSEGLLRHLGEGRGPAETLNEVLERCPEPERRQLGVIAASGEAAFRTGERCVPFAEELSDQGFLGLGNMLHKRGSIAAMETAFYGSLSISDPKRILLALVAADRAGGDLRGRQSAALVVRYASDPWRDVDLRVDDHTDPLAELSRLLRLHEQYQVLDDPAVRTGTVALRQAAEAAVEEAWPDEVKFWLAALLVQFGSSDANTFLDPLIAREPWRTVWQRLQDVGQMFEGD